MCLNISLVLEETQIDLLVNILHFVIQYCGRRVVLLKNIYYLSKLIVFASNVLHLGQHSKKMGNTKI